MEAMQLVMAQQDDAVSPKDWLNSVLEEAAPKASAVWDDWGATALVIVAALVVAIGVMRVVAGRRARRRRRTVLLKPSNKFDPSPEEVLRFCGQLARVHSATTRVTEPASTRTIRVTLTGAGEGRMAQLLSGPAAAEQILRHRGFAQVELADPAAMLSSGASGPGSEATREQGAAEPSQSITTTAVEGETGVAPVGDGRVDDPPDPSLEVGAEDWPDSDHGGYPDGPPEALEWTHPEEERLLPSADEPAVGVPG